MTKKIAKRILTLAKKIISDHKNSNLYLEVLESFQDDDEEVVIACCDSAGKVFSHFIEATEFLETDAEKDEKDRSKDNVFHGWLLDQYKTTCDILYKHLTGDSVSVQISSIESLTAILSGLGTKNSEPYKSNGTEIWEKVIGLLLDKEHDRGKVIAEIPAFISASGNEGEMLTICLTCIHKNLKDVRKIKDAEAFNLWSIVTQMTANFELEGKARSLLNKIVLGFLKLELPIKLYKEILTKIDSVIDKMTTPLLLADFLTQSFNIGGAISLMSLNGLFVLMHKYNLNYPDFYEKLYSMFQPQIFGAKYRARFFHLADLFLSSTHLPSYLVAAFVKRLARLALHSPATGVQIIVPFIFNLIQRHPACDVLLHKAEGPMEFNSDPYLDDKPIAECHALESCVWELQTLEHHFDPSVSTKAKKRQIQEEDVSAYLEKTVTEIMDSEAKKRKKDVALTFEKQTDFELGMFVL